MSGTPEQWDEVFKTSSRHQLVSLIRHLAECEEGLVRQLEASLQEKKELESKVKNLEGRLFGFSS